MTSNDTVTNINRAARKTGSRGRKALVPFAALLLFGSLSLMATVNRWRCSSYDSRRLQVFRANISFENRLSLSRVGLPAFKTQLYSKSLPIARVPCLPNLLDAH